TSLFFALFAAYAFHNLFVFDNLTSYFLFFSILGYLHFKYIQMHSEAEPESPIKRQAANIGPASYLLITLAFAAVVFSLYFINIKPILAGRQLITALGEMQAKGADVDFMLGEFDKAFSYNTFANNEAREQLGQYSQQVFSSQGISQEDKTKAISKAIEEMERQAVESSNDARSWLFLVSLYIRANRFDDGLKAANRALELSPKKQQIYFTVADIYLRGGKIEEALNMVQKAYDLDPSFSEAAKNLAIIAIINKKQDLVDKLMPMLEKEYGSRAAIEKELINAYAQAGNYEKVKQIWQAVIEKEPNNAQLHVSLAATYLQLGDRINAVKELEKAAELNPGFKQQAEYYINEIKAGRNP
ncbi:MAG: tetratricopeptide repeat protein, partial [bacterium]|nr:tetratricopeptide repeat protein [bacterium]